MAGKPILLFLHGVGTGDEGGLWKTPLSAGLSRLGYPGLNEVSVVAPLYAHALRGTDDRVPLPPLTVKAPSGDEARRNRREFERRTGAVELALGRHQRGTGWFGANLVTGAALAQHHFIQANNYLNKPQIRAQVLRRVLRRLPQSGRLVIVGHSLGSVIAADLVRRLPVGLNVVGMATVGSPLAHPLFDVDRLGETLKEPPTNLGWWVNFWNSLDPVTMHRGVSSVFPWMIDFRIWSTALPEVHDAETYLSNDSVACAVGLALFGSRSKELAVIDAGLDIPLDYAETVAMMALRYGYLMKARLKGDQRDRFADALRQVQASTVELLRQRNAHEGRPLPAELARLAFDLSDSGSIAPEPRPIGHLSKDDAVVPLLSLAAVNVVHPFEISVSMETRRKAMGDLTVEMWLGSQIGADVFTAAEDARKILTGSGGTNWFRWVALGVGAAALVAATGGLALMAAPGAVGAAAITSALAAFGPGGMIGGLLTAGALVTAGGGGIALGVASSGTAAETVEALVGARLAAAILRKRQGIEQDPTTWESLVEAGIEVRREHARLEAISDESARSLKELRRKLDAIDRALNYLNDHGLGPNEPPSNGGNPTRD